MDHAPGVGDVLAAWKTAVKSEFQTQISVCNYKLRQE